MFGRFKGWLSKLGGRSEEVEEDLQFDFGEGRITGPFYYREEIEGPGGPVSPGETADVVLAMAQAFDSQARLIRVVSQRGVDSDGRALAWQFEFLFPARWGQGSVILTVEEPGLESVAIQVRPFPAPGSAMANMLATGQDGFVEQQWKVEQERHSPLPLPFVDTLTVVEDWRNSGKIGKLGVDYQLEGIQPPLGGPVWQLTKVQNPKQVLASSPFQQ